MCWPHSSISTVTPNSPTTTGVNTRPPKAVLSHKPAAPSGEMDTRFLLSPSQLATSRGHRGGQWQPRRDLPRTQILPNVVTNADGNTMSQAGTCRAAFRGMAMRAACPVLLAGLMIHAHQTVPRRHVSQGNILKRPNGCLSTPVYEYGHRIRGWTSGKHPVVPWLHTGSVVPSVSPMSWLGCQCDSKHSLGSPPCLTRPEFWSQALRIHTGYPLTPSRAACGWSKHTSALAEESG